MAALLRYSGAAEGDRTMLDALIPAQQHFAESLHQGMLSDSHSYWYVHCSLHDSLIRHQMF